jgi:uncharacterized protein YndB with AHSA1/START domain
MSVAKQPAKCLNCTLVIFARLPTFAITNFTKLKQRKMETESKTPITVESIVKAPMEKVWQFFTEPEHIRNWNNAVNEWHTPHAENDLKPGGKFVYRMEAKDGSFGFDFNGVYDDVRANELIAYTLGDGRKVTIRFSSHESETKVVETFEAEETNSLELQRTGWQAILDNFKRYTEANA